jgi:hypothetical protein
MSSESGCPMPPAAPRTQTLKAPGGAFGFAFAFAFAFGSALALALDLAFALALGSGSDFLPFFFFAGSHSSQ